VNKQVNYQQQIEKTYHPENFDNGSMCYFCTMPGEEKIRISEDGDGTTIRVPVCKKHYLEAENV